MASGLFNIKERLKWVSQEKRYRETAWINNENILAKKLLRAKDS